MIPAFSFGAEAGPHLLTPEGRKAELAWASGRNIKVTLKVRDQVEMLSESNR